MLVTLRAILSRVQMNASFAIIKQATLTHFNNYLLITWISLNENLTDDVYGFVCVAGAKGQPHQMKFEVNHVR